MSLMFLSVASFSLFFSLPPSRLVVTSPAHDDEKARRAFQCSILAASSLAVEASRRLTAVIRLERFLLVSPSRDSVKDVECKVNI